VDLLVRKGLGVQTRLVSLYTLDLGDLLAEGGAEK
jgi:hypothetical protein